MGMVRCESEVPTQSKVRRPDFMIIGAMKSGTTTLYHYIGMHPGVFMCFPKEPMFFSRDEVYARGLDWYFSLFREAREDQICGEANATLTASVKLGEQRILHTAIVNHLPGLSQDSLFAFPTTSGHPAKAGLF